MSTEMSRVELSMLSTYLYKHTPTWCFEPRVTKNKTNKNNIPRYPIPIHGSEHDCNKEGGSGGDVDAQSHLTTTSDIMIPKKSKSKGS